jgi:uncharacterized protein (TIGR02300 family)
LAKPEWGTKRLCQSCGERFYDLKRNPITCPKCQAVHAGDRAAKPRRAPVPVAVAPAVAAPERKIEDTNDPPVAAEDTEEVVVSSDSEADGANSGDDDDIVVEDKGGDDNLIEDTLEGDNDDIAVVNESVEKEETI